jgi:hypothetical protein
MVFDFAKSDFPIALAADQNSWRIQGQNIKTTIGLVGDF